MSITQTPVQVMEVKTAAVCRNSDGDAELCVAAPYAETLWN